MFTLFDPKKQIDFVGMMKVTTKIGFAIPITSIVLLAVLGINWGLDFSGGTEMQVKFPQAVSTEEVKTVLREAGFAKNQVQQYGPSENNELLIRVERMTSLTDADVARIEKLLKENFETLRFGAKGTAEDISVSFDAHEGDRITVRLPEPQPSRPAAKNADPAAVAAALKARLLSDAEPKPLDDAAIDALSAEGFDRAALVSQANTLGIEVTASMAKRSEPAFSEALAKAAALRAQKQALTKLLDEKSGARLRRTKGHEDKKASVDDAVIQDEPYQGKVKYLVQFRGVSVDIERALADHFAKGKADQCVDVDQRPDFCPEIRRVEFVDAQVAEDLQTDGVLAVVYALIGILIYVAIRFDFFFSPGAVIALVHDAIGALMLFALGMQFDQPSIAAVLTVVGYSINNTIVIYDRIRETVPNTPDHPLSDEEVAKGVHQAINDTFSRTVNTSLTTLFASLALFFFAGGVVRNFAAVLSVGIVLGAFSSTFLAPATYLFFNKNFKKAEPTQGGKVKTGLSREEKARGVV